MGGGGRREAEKLRAHFVVNLQDESPNSSLVDARLLYTRVPVIATLFANGIVMCPMALVEPSLEPYASTEPTKLNPVA